MRNSPGLQWSVRIGEVLEEKGDLSLGHIVYAGHSSNRGGEVNRLEKREAQVGSDNFVNAVVLKVLADKLQDEIARLISRFFAGDAEGPACVGVGSVPAAQQGVDLGVLVNRIKTGDGLDCEGVFWPVDSIQLKLLKPAARLEPERAGSVGESRQILELLIDRATSRFIGVFLRAGFFRWQ